MLDIPNRAWVIHPLSKPNDPGQSPGKRPLLKGWQRLRKTPDSINEYITQGYNIGLVCGAASGVTVIDFDHKLFIDDALGDVVLNTLMSCRTEGRGHIFFNYVNDLPSQKHHHLGIEVLNDGSNAVLPPSIHTSGKGYRWKDREAPIMEMPAEVLDRFANLFRTETELKEYIYKARPCFRHILKDKPNVSGSDGRLLMVAVSTELMAVGAGEQHMKMFAKLMYGSSYDEKITAEELSYINPKKTWRCQTLRQKFAHFDQYCSSCMTYTRPGMTVSTQAQAMTVPDNVMQFFRSMTDAKESVTVFVIKNNVPSRSNR